MLDATIVIVFVSIITALLGKMKQLKNHAKYATKNAEYWQKLNTDRRDVYSEENTKLRKDAEAHRQKYLNLARKLKALGKYCE